jgi:hypothetical protein
LEYGTASGGGYWRVVSVLTPGFIFATESGTEFPTGAALTAFGDNRPFFRTDLGESYYSDGTRWLSCATYSGALASGDPVFPYTAGARLGRCPSYQGADIYVVDMVTGFYVVAPNDGTRYWTITLGKISTANVRTVIGSRNTSAYPAATWAPDVVAVGVVIAAAAHPLLDILLDPVNSPGALYGTAGFHYRKVAT